MTERERDEQDLEMLRLIDKGLTRKQTAARLGLTKCAVIGRIDRIRKAMKAAR